MRDHRINDKGVPVSESLKRNLEALDVFIGNTSEKYNLSFQQVLDLLSKKEKSGVILAPSFILRERTLGILEAVIKYLKEERNLTYHKIAVLLNRDDRVVWATYNNAIKKKKERFVVEEPNYWLPVSIFAETALGPLEAISKYLIDDAQLDFIDAAKLLNRDSKSIWACYSRSKKKLTKNGTEV